jgi:hypothetical protein
MGTPPALRLATCLALAALLALPALATPAPAPLLPSGLDGLVGHPFVGAPRGPQEIAGAGALAQRFLPRPAGTVVEATFAFGPYPIQAGWDLSRLDLGVQMVPGFVTKLGYRVVDAATGQPYNNMQVHIHHGLWFRAGSHSEGQFIFGTGEEYTSIDLDARSAAEPAGLRYGLGFASGERMFIVLMLHNKEPTQRVVNILVDLTFVHGTAAEIQAAQGCGEPAPLGLVLPPAGCVAGAVMHNVNGYLWGDIFNVPREADGDGIFVYPLEGESVAPRPPDVPWWLPLPGSPIDVPGIQVINTSFVAPRDATLVHAGGHVHQGGMETVVVNLGSATAPCGDLDGDGLDGITLYRSRKFDRVPGSFPASEDFQMGVTKPGYRAPIRAGDRIGQYGIYANRDFASYQAMTFSAAHLDEEQSPGARTGPCTLANTAPWLIAGAPGEDPTETVPNRPWTGDPLPVCGDGLGPACDGPVEVPADGLYVTKVAIAGFSFVPGDQHLAGPLGAPPKIPKWGAVQFANADAGAVVRHTVTSCAWPCNGPYRANYPMPDGLFDSDRLGNFDYFDSGSIPPESEDDPVWRVPVGMERGLYSYFCRLHPSMRGWFEVV